MNEMKLTAKLDSFYSRGQCLKFEAIEQREHGFFYQKRDISFRQVDAEV